MIYAAVNTLASYARRFMVDADVWRRQTTYSPGGGQTVEWVDQERTVEVQMVSPSPDEREAAMQQGVEITHVAVLPVDADVQRHDRLVIGSDDPYQLKSDPQTATHSPVSRANAKQTPWES